MRLAQIDHVTGCARVVSAFLQIPVWSVAYWYPVAWGLLFLSLGAACCYFTPVAPFVYFVHSFRQQPGSGNLLKRQWLVVPTDSSQPSSRLIALSADVSNRLCIGIGPPQKQATSSNLSVSPWKSARTGLVQKGFQNLTILSGFHRPWQPARHLPPQLCLDLKTGNDAWTTSQTGMVWYVWMESPKVHWKSFPCQAGLAWACIFSVLFAISFY